MKLNTKKVVQVNASTLKIYCKVCDNFSASLDDDEGNELVDYEGYVPEFMPGDHFGDYLILDIEIDTGKILNWKVPTAGQIEAFIDTE